jgi:hypothetical protein
VPIPRADRASGRPTALTTRPQERAHPTQLPSNVLPGRTVQQPSTLGPPTAASYRPFSPGDAQRPRDASRPDGLSNRPAGTPPHRSSDHRYARPASGVVRPHPHAHHRPPRVYTYSPWYTRWYCHPYYRYHYSTVAVVGFGFAVYPWYDYWAPPPRYGWMWMPGYWTWGYWYPGHWRPLVTAPVGYVYVPGWWEADVYVDGYYRVEQRDDWYWVDGYYLDDGTYIRGHWAPDDGAPEGYTWVPGFWDGEQYVDGFWRPEYRQGFRWVSGFYDEDGVFEAGYWLPVDERVGEIWVPGWFDGNTWVEGYWVGEDDYYSTDIESWQPEEGWDDGWEVGAGWGDGEVLENRSGDPPSSVIVERLVEETGHYPLAVPVVIPEDAELEEPSER